MQTLAIITGAGSGIGQALAVELAVNHKMKVLGVGRRLQTLQETQIQYPERIQIVAADVGSEQGRNRILQSIPAGSAVKFLIHNAAVIFPIKPLCEISLEEWQAHQAINVEGPLFLTQLLLPRFENGRVLHISSGLAHYALVGSGAYCASKAALYMLYLVMREELKKYNIAVGSLRPGIVDTPMQDEIRSAAPEHFPDLSRFIGYKEQGKLSDPRTVASFIAQVLLRTDDEEFSAKEWDAREDSTRFK